MSDLTIACLAILAWNFVIVVWVSVSSAIRLRRWRDQNSDRGIF